MSYCRWSTNDFQCDLYCYESDAGYMTHVAGNRVVFDEPLPEKVGWDDVEKFVARHRKVSDMVDKAKREFITLECAGETFCDSTLEEFTATLTMLRGLGYIFPDYVFDRIKEEMEEKQ